MTATDDGGPNVRFLSRARRDSTPLAGTRLTTTPRHCTRVVAAAVAVQFDDINDAAAASATATQPPEKGPGVFTARRHANAA
jgi:hypothetical protein